MAPREKRITTKELARDLGVSRATIDRALHGRGRINEKTRARIEDRARELGYRPNLVARSLALTRPVRIVTLFPSHPASFFDEVREGIRSAADAFADHPFSVEVLHTDQHDLEQQRAIVGEINADACDGLVIAPAHGEALNTEIDRLADSGVLVICVNTDAPHSRRTTFIGQNFVRAGRLVAELLAKLAGGRGRILTLGGFPDVYAHTERLRGFVQEIVERYPGMTVVPGPDCFDDPDRAYGAVRNAVRTDEGDEPLAGVFAATGAGTYGVARALKEQRQRGDQKARFVGFDLFPEVEPYFEEEIIDAIVVQNPFRQGYDAIEQMHRYFIERRTDLPEMVYTGADLVLRNNNPRFP